MTITVNGVVMANVENSRYPGGAIGLPQNAGVIKWRKLRGMRPLAHA